jgi:Tol biopolymer transport system component
MTPHDFRPNGAAVRPGAAQRSGRAGSSTRPRVAVRAVLVAASVGALLGLGPPPASAEEELRPAIALTSSRDGPGFSFQIYLMLMKPDGTPDGTDPRRLTTTAATADNPGCCAFPVLSPDGKQIVFDSNRNRAAGEPLNTSDLFLMKSDGTEQRRLTRGSSASWSPDGKRLAFHASASGTGLPVPTTPPNVPGVPTTDSDIFVAKVGDLLDHGTGRTNLTNSPEYLDYDADWSPDGNRIAFVRRPKNDLSTDPNPPSTELYVINADGTGLKQLTSNSGGTAAPDWSPDGKRIAFMCREVPTGVIEICVMNADGTGREQLTRNSVFEGTPIWSPDGTKILFSRQLGQGAGQELFVMNADGTGVTQLTNTPGANFLASWGVLRVKAP